MSVFITYVLPDGSIKKEDYLPEDTFPGVSDLPWMGDIADFNEISQYDFRVVSSEDQSYEDGSQIHEVILAAPRVH
jgi:hypothetical protein